MKPITLTTLCACSLIATNCGAADKSTASITYSLNGGHTLYAYPLKPANATREMDAIANHVLGTILLPDGKTTQIYQVRSPNSPYYCTWRNPSPWLHTASGLPANVFMVCLFGSAPWTPPASMMDEAQERAKRHEAVVRLKWERVGTQYVIKRADVEISDPQGHRFLSSNSEGPDGLGAMVQQHAVIMPKTLLDDVKFDISITARYRLNTGEVAHDPTVTLRMSGTAAPTPKWLNY